MYVKRFKKPKDLLVKDPYVVPCVSGELRCPSCAVPCDTVEDNFSREIVDDDPAECAQNGRCIKGFMVHP